MKSEHKKAIQVELETIDRAKSDLENIRDELQEQFDDMPEKQQEGDKGEKLRDEIGDVDCAIDSLSEIIDKLNQAVV